MKAAAFDRFGGPEVLAMRELPDPVPGPGEALVCVRACGVNHLPLVDAPRAHAILTAREAFGKVILVPS